MKKIINAPESVIEQMLQGQVKAFADIERIGERNALAYRNRANDQVALIVGGGSGHEPLFGGFIGQGLAAAAVCGNIFTSPNPDLIYQTAEYIDNGRGVIFVYGNYAGDNMNFDMAEELCELNGIKTGHVRVWDDVASAPQERCQDRRGIAGDVFVIQIAGAACAAGLDLEEVIRITEKARDNVASIGLATSPGMIPGLDQPTFELGADEIEFGMGLHGEPGIERTKMQPSRELVRRMYQEIKQDMNLQAGDQIAVLVNGLGSTTLLELSIAYNDLHNLLENDRIKVLDSDINSYCTCQEMGGFSITIFRLDQELKSYYYQDCQSHYYAKHWHLAEQEENK